MKQKMSRASGVDCAAAAFVNGRGLSWSKNFLKKVLTFGAARSIINTVLKRETKVNKLVLMTLRVHLFPYRTQKLSSVVPKILGW